VERISGQIQRFVYFYNFKRKL